MSVKLIYSKHLNLYQIKKKGGGDKITYVSVYECYTKFDNCLYIYFIKRIIHKHNIPIPTMCFKTTTKSYFLCMCVLHKHFL